MSEWQPIETAPKDQRVLVLVKENIYPGGRPTFAYWDAERSWWRECGFNTVLPTHWMPLPPAPDGPR